MVMLPQRHNLSPGQNSDIRKSARQLSALPYSVPIKLKAAPIISTYISVHLS